MDVDDDFDRLLGHRRGQTDVRELTRQVATAERHLKLTRDELENSTDGHPLASGLALRQASLWWDAEMLVYRISANSPDNSEWPALTREHLLAVLNLLEEKLARLWQAEHRRVPWLYPGLVHAHLDASSWLHDTPQYRALEAERRRRRIRKTSGEMPQPPTEHPTWLDELAP